jgi:hypothetical protein
VSSSDLGLGIVMLAIAAAYYRLGTSIPQSALDDAVGPRGLPRAYAIVLAALAVMTIARGALSRTRHSEPGAGKRKQDTPARSWRFIGLALIGVAYLAVVPWLGYLVSIALLIAGTTWYQGGSISRRALVVAGSGAVFLWLLFVVLLGIPQPSGAWSAIF